MGNCFSSSTGRTNKEAHPYARVVDLISGSEPPPPYTAHGHTAQLPSRYLKSRERVIYPDEKEHTIFISEVEPQQSRPASSASSVVSMPYTHVGSDRTGSTVAPSSFVQQSVMVLEGIDTGSESGSDIAPPSYRESRTPSPHPVMGRDWLDMLQRRAME